MNATWLLHLSVSVWWNHKICWYDTMGFHLKFSAFIQLNSSYGLVEIKINETDETLSGAQLAMYCRRVWRCYAAYSLSSWAHHANDSRWKDKIVFWWFVLLLLPQWLRPATTGKTTIATTFTAHENLFTLNDYVWNNFSVMRFYRPRGDEKCVCVCLCVGVCAHRFWIWLNGFETMSRLKSFTTISDRYRWANYFVTRSGECMVELNLTLPFYDTWNFELTFTPKQIQCFRLI